jgi:hypothetical protein
VAEPQSITQIGNHSVKCVRKLSELTATPEISARVEVAIADSLHKADQR